MNESDVIAVSSRYLQCPECNIRDVRYRLKSDDYYCRRCGCIFYSISGKQGYKMYPKNKIKE